MAKQTYEVIEKSNVVNMNNETVKALEVGDSVSGTMVMIDDNPYLEIVADHEYVTMNGLAQKLDESELQEVAATVKSSSKKLIFALVGAGVGFGIATAMKMDLKKKIIFTLGGIAAGLAVEYVNARKA